MLSIEILAVGRLKNDPLVDVFDEFCKRLVWKISLTELDDRPQETQTDRLFARLAPSARVIVLDERGKSIPSRTFAQMIKDIQDTTSGSVQFVIGGAEGVGDKIRARADVLLSFGQQTWPHKLARVMLIEQIYRAQQILSGHPYHRD